MNLLVRGQTGTCVYAGSREHSCSPQTPLTFRERAASPQRRGRSSSGRYELTTTGAQAIWTASKSSSVVKQNYTHAQPFCSWPEPSAEISGSIAPTALCFAETQRWVPTSHE